MDHWEFYSQRQNGPDYTEWCWRWRVKTEDGAIVRTSSCAFRTIVSCIEDARRHGFHGEPPNSPGNVSGTLEFRRV